MRSAACVDATNVHCVDTDLHNATHYHVHLDVIEVGNAVRAQVDDLEAAAGGQRRRQRGDVVVPEPQLRQRLAAIQVGVPQAGQLQRSQCSLGMQGAARNEVTC